MAFPSGPARQSILPMRVTLVRTIISLDGLLIPRQPGYLPLRRVFHKSARRTKNRTWVKGRRARAEGSLSRQVAGKEDCESHEADGWGALSLGLPLGDRGEPRL